MKVCMIIPPKVERKYVHREDKHVSMHDEPFVPYTAPLHYALIEQEIENVELSLIEAQRDDLELDEVLKKLDEINPDIVVTYLGWISIPWDRKVAETNYPTIAIIVQQWIDQIEAVKLYNLKNKYTLFKEIEAPLIEGIKEFQSSGIIEKASGIIIEKNGEYSLSSMPNFFDMNKLPIPNFRIFQLEKYLEMREKIMKNNLAKVGFLNTMKSCPYTCAFCGQSNDGTKIRYQPVEYVVKQLKYLNKEYGISKFIFIDNVHTTSKRRAKELAEKIIESGLQIKYSINDRLGKYDQALADILKKSGCFEVRIGIETIDPKLQIFLNKKLDFKVAREEIDIIHKSGIQTYLYFITGVPGETKKELRLNAKFASEVNATNFTVSPLFIMPGSPLYQRLKVEKKVLLDDWSEYRKFDSLTYINETYNNIEEIEKSTLYLKRKIYLYKLKYFKRGTKYMFINVIKYLSTFIFMQKISNFIPTEIRKKLKNLISSR